VHTDDDNSCLNVDDDDDDYYYHDHRYDGDDNEDEDEDDTTTTATTVYKYSLEQLAFCTCRAIAEESGYNAPPSLGAFSLLAR